MIQNIHTQDTICAIATAQGGAIGVIRVSGDNAITITEKIFVPIGKNTLSQKAPYTLTFGRILGENDELIDEVLVSLFKAPHSYTGEDAIEISCHGSSYILQQVMQLLIKNGCRAAAPGEFTQRAFLNGKMDLSQAEAVADVIASTSAATHRLAMNQMRGGFSRELTNLRDQLLHLTSLMELELDFADHEELEFADRTELKALAGQIDTTISRLTETFKVGNAIKNGIPVAIIGETNAGKSTLLNALLNEDKAIVSDIHGTTRDVIEDTMNINGVIFRFIDTAGIRQTEDTIEALGIERSFKALEHAQIVVLMYDMTRPQASFEEFLTQITPHIRDKQIIIAKNKCDVMPNDITLDKLSLKGIQDNGCTIDELAISAKARLHIDQLKEKLYSLSSLPSISSSDVIVTNLRHYEALVRALESIRRVEEGLSTQLSGDFISQDLRECIFHLSDIVGEVTTDIVLQNIFKHFCIGK